METIERNFLSRNSHRRSTEPPPPPKVYYYYSVRLLKYFANNAVRGAAAVNWTTCLFYPECAALAGDRANTVPKYNYIILLLTGFGRNRPEIECSPNKSCIRYVQVSAKIRPTGCDLLPLYWVDRMLGCNNNKI